MIPIPKSEPTPRQRFLDGIFVGLLIVYTIAGVIITPFHGDESTIIHMARDFYALTAGEFSSLTYQSSPTTRPEAQELRMLNGNLSFWGIGIMAKLTGLSIDDLALPWDWSSDYQNNIAAGHRPSAQTLLISRLWSIFCTSLSISLLFVLGRRLGGRQLAWLAALCFTLLPPMLLNGRRANFEGTTLLTTMLTLLFAVILLQRLKQRKEGRLHWVLFGVSCGLAVASKHNSLLLVAPLFVLLLINVRRWATVGGLLTSGIIMVAVFIALDPVWWTLPLELPREVLRLRSDLLQGQAEHYGSFPPTVDGWLERIRAGITYIFAPPQYYEVNAGWPDWIGAEIARYEASWLWGAPVRAAIWVALTAVGLIVLRRDAVGWLIRGLWIFILLTLILLNPLPWQRYYLPLAPFVAIFCGAGIGWLLNLLAAAVGRQRVQPA